MPHLGLYEPGVGRVAIVLRHDTVYSRDQEHCAVDWRVAPGAAAKVGVRVVGVVGLWMEVVGWVTESEATLLEPLARGAESSLEREATRHPLGRP